MKLEENLVEAVVGEYRLQQVFKQNIGESAVQVRILERLEDQQSTFSGSLISDKQS